MKISEDLLRYRNEDVISRFTGIFRIEEEEAKDIFQETKKFLSIGRTEGVFISEDLLVIDEMWHNFILFTRDYEEFCMRCFGVFLHHTPTSRTEKEKFRMLLASNPEEAAERMERMNRKFMGIVYDELGEETAMKWFGVYPEKYSRTYLNSIRT